MNASKDFDEAKAHRALIAFAAVWRYDDFKIPPSNDIYTMFCVAGRVPGSAPDDYSDLVRQSGYNIVMLEFAPGQERSGPSGVVVLIRWHDGTIRTFSDCVLWQGPQHKIMTLISRETETSIVYDGTNLRIIDGTPDCNLEVGIMAARRTLRAAVRRALTAKEPLWGTESASPPH